MISAPIPSMSANRNQHLNHIGIKNLNYNNFSTILIVESTDIQDFIGFLDIGY